MWSLVLGVVDHAAGVVDGAEREDAGLQPAVAGLALRRPSMAGMNEQLPVAMISSSYGVTLTVPSAMTCTSLANRSILLDPDPGVQGDVVLVVPVQAC